MPSQTPQQSSFHVSVIAQSPVRRGNALVGKRHDTGLGGVTWGGTMRMTVQVKTGKNTWGVSPCWVPWHPRRPRKDPLLPPTRKPAHPHLPGHALPDCLLLFTIGVTHAGCLKCSHSTVYSTAAVGLKLLADWAGLWFMSIWSCFFGGNLLK